ncbi:hypothetical protein WJX72_009535 [[Myrmecia] bisecta]|uniref:Insulin-degrading enzyme n=1 Tax=[Myrmecia] bisecta TaxID=41462 RepID=A0AAW1P5E1_9CHLO
MVGSLSQQAGEPQVVKPTIDQLEYRVVTFDNGLQALLISDAETDKAAAAVDVRIGALSDPAELPGLAHFTEHMLFYASEKYPKEDEYSRFVSEHGGSTNAYTAGEDTNYHFDVNWDHLEPTLDRFAQFFISPLISVDGVEREVKAVDSEHGKNVNSDPWRQMQLWKHTSNPKHPFCSFSTGNIDTLMHTPKSKGINVREAVCEFHRQHYSANVMKLTVYGRESLDDLQALVQDKFAAVVDKQIMAPSFPEDVITEAQMGKLLKVVPQKDGHTLELQWSVPSEQQNYRAAPCSYLSHLLGHEGEGSVFALLKKQGWATGLSAGEGGSSFSTRSFFMVKVELTDEGHQHVKEIGATVFAYLDILNQPDGVAKHHYDENRALAQLRFNFADKSNPYDYASHLAASMHTYPPQDLLLALHNVPFEFDPAAIRAVLAELTPQQARVMWASKTFQGQTTEVEPWYETQYTLSAIPEDWLAEWSSPRAHPQLHLPAPNPFIPTNFDLIEVGEGASKQPGVISETPLVRLWHRPNTTFRMPKAVIYLAFTLPEAYATPEYAVLTRIFVKLLADYLNEISYPAELAGLHYGTSNTTSGFLLWVSGYNHKIMPWLQTVLERVASFAVQANRFEIQKSKAAKEYANMKYEQPYQHALYITSVLLEARRWHVREYEAVIGDLQPADLTDFFARVFKRCFVEGYSTGNLAEPEVLQMGRSVETLLQEKLQARPLFPSQHVEARAIKLPQGQASLLSEPVPNPENENSAIVVTYQVGLNQALSNVLAELLVQCAKRDAFHTLRTVEQLGYMVFLSAWWNLSVRSVVFIIQSTAYGAEHLESRVASFVEQYCQTLAEMDDAAFHKQVEELAKDKLEKPKRLRQEAAREWKEIDEGMLMFDRREREVDALRQLTKADLVDFYKAFVVEAATRRKLSVHVRGADPAEADVGNPDRDTLLAAQRDRRRPIQHQVQGV